MNTHFLIFPLFVIQSIVPFPGAEAGTLTFMVGGAEADVTAAKELLQHMGKNVVHCGGPGTGGVAKVCNNLVLGINMVGVAEAMNLGQKLGEWCGVGEGRRRPLIVRGKALCIMSHALVRVRLLSGIEPSVLASVLNTSSGRSWVTELYNPCPGVLPNAPSSKGYAGKWTRHIVL